MQQQQAGPQFDWTQSLAPGPTPAQLLAQTQSPAQLVAQQPQGYPQPQAYAQPQPQTYVQPYTMPMAQPYAQPQAQAYAQPQGQPYSPPATQAPPVPGVAAPVAPTSGAANAQQSPQQQFAKHLTGIARTLEQAIPGYQILISMLQDLAASPRGQSVTGLPILLEQWQQTVFHHYATLGSIRRFLCGEATPDVLAALATGVNWLISLHSKTRPLWEQAVASASPDLQRGFAILNPAVTGADTLLQQAAQAVQAAVGPQVWAAAQARVQSATSATPASP